MISYLQTDNLPTDRYLNYKTISYLQTDNLPTDKEEQSAAMPSVTTGFKHLLLAKLQAANVPFHSPEGRQIIVKTACENRLNKLLL